MWLLLSILSSSSSLLVGIVIDMIVCCDYCAVYDDKQCDDGGGIYFVGWQRMMTKMAMAVGAVVYVGSGGN